MADLRQIDELFAYLEYGTDLVIVDELFGYLEFNSNAPIVDEVFAYLEYIPGTGRTAGPPLQTMG